MRYIVMEAAGASMKRKGMTASPVAESPVEAKLPDRPVITMYDTIMTIAWKMLVISSE